MSMMPTTTKSLIVPLSELANKAFVTSGYGPADRIDPFWAMVFPDTDGGPKISWRSIHSDREMAAVGTQVPIRRGGRRTQAEAIALLPRRQTRLITLGTINLWRTITGQQIAAMTGRPGLNSARSEETGLLYDTGLIQRGLFYYSGRSLGQVPEIFRPDAQANKVDLTSLRNADWSGITLGDSLLNGHQYDRHNILTTELSLRAAEMCPLRTVLGEARSTWSQLFDPTLKPNRYRSADAVWVRTDGLLIAVEMTATVTPATIKKIDQLAELLSRDTCNSLVVLFVVAARPRKGRTGDVTNRLRKAVKKSAHSSMSRVRAGVEKRIMIVRWEDWFPSPGLVSRDFIGLNAQRYSSVDKEWSFTQLLDPFDVTYAGADLYLDKATNAGYDNIFGAPWWMRTGPGADFDAPLPEWDCFDERLAIKVMTDSSLGE